MCKDCSSPLPWLCLCWALHMDLWVLPASHCYSSLFNSLHFSGSGSWCSTKASSTTLSYLVLFDSDLLRTFGYTHHFSADYTPFYFSWVPSTVYVIILLEVEEHIAYMLGGGVLPQGLGVRPYKYFNSFFIYSFVFSFPQQIFIEWLLCVQVLF